MWENLSRQRAAAAARRSMLRVLAVFFYLLDPA